MCRDGMGYLVDLVSEDGRLGLQAGHAYPFVDASRQDIQAAQVGAALQVANVPRMARVNLSAVLAVELADAVERATRREQDGPAGVMER